MRVPCVVLRGNMLTSLFRAPAGPVDSSESSAQLESNMSLSLHAPVARDLVALRARSHSAASCCTSPARLPALRNSGRRGALSLRAGPETETEGSPLDFPEVSRQPTCVFSTRSSRRRLG